MGPSCSVRLEAGELLEAARRRAVGSRPYADEETQRQRSRRLIRPPLGQRLGVRNVSVFVCSDRRTIATLAATTLAIPTA
jgi:hypothetical protein